MRTSVSETIKYAIAFYTRANSKAILFCFVCIIALSSFKTVYSQENNVFNNSVHTIYVPLISHTAEANVVQNEQILISDAAVGLVTDALYVRVSKSLLPSQTSGASAQKYYVYVAKNNQTLEPYSGNVKVKVEICPTGSSRGSAGCTWVGQNCDVTWAYAASNGLITVLPTTALSDNQKFYASFKPNNCSGSWSNEIQVNINTTEGLYHVEQDYWKITDTNTRLLDGINNYYPGNSTTTRINYSTESGAIKSMNFAKSSIYGYWNAKFPFHPFITNNDKDLKFLITWEPQTPPRHDTYLRSTGWKQYTSPLNPDGVGAFGGNPTSTMSFSSSVGNYEIPVYTLAPKWVGIGWGISASGGFAEAGFKTWAVHIDPAKIKDKNGTTKDGLRISFYESGHCPGFTGMNYTAVINWSGCSSVPSNTYWVGFREDYFFRKGDGIVRIDQKFFGSHSFTEGGRVMKPCAKTSTNPSLPWDVDCIVNQTMQSPDITTERRDLKPLTITY